MVKEFIVSPEDIIDLGEIYAPHLHDAEIAKLEARKNAILGEERDAKRKAAALRIKQGETADEFRRRQNRTANPIGKDIPFSIGGRIINLAKGSDYHLVRREYVRGRNNELASITSRLRELKEAKFKKDVVDAVKNPYAKVDKVAKKAAQKKVFIEGALKEGKITKEEATKAGLFGPSEAERFKYYLTRFKGKERASARGKIKRRMDKGMKFDDAVKDAGYVF